MPLAVGFAKTGEVIQPFLLCIQKGKLVSLQFMFCLAISFLMFPFL